MGGVNRSLGWVQDICAWMAAGATLLLFAIVALNVLARAIFDATGGGINLLFSGAVELSQYALMIAVFAAIPAMLGAGLIRVDILSATLPLRLQKGLDRLWMALLGVFGGVLSLAFFDLAATALRRGDATQDLQWPLWPFYGIAALETLALMVLAIGTAVTNYEPGKGPLA